MEELIKILNETSDVEVMEKALLEYNELCKNREKRINEIATQIDVLIKEKEALDDQELYNGVSKFVHKYGLMKLGLW